MKNIEKLTQHITQHGTKGILIHTIPKTNNWLICKKIAENLWSLSLENPMGYTTYNLGTVTDEQHTALWIELIKYKAKEIQKNKLANELKETINNFLKSNQNIKTQNTKIKNKNKIIKELREKIINFNLTHI